MENEKWTLQSIGTKLAVHIAGDEERDEKTDAMYKIIVTGNGVPALPEVVRGHDEWIKKQKERAKAKRNLIQEYGKGVVLLVLGQVLSVIVGGIAIFLEIKK
jgi:hypothetical protein